MRIHIFIRIYEGFCLEKAKNYNREDDILMTGARFMKDEIESIPQESDACEIKTPDDHRMMFRALENPLRRKIVKSIGSFGKTKNEIMKELKISESQLKFQLDFLLKECYAQVDGDKCTLNSKGLQELLANIK